MRLKIEIEITGLPKYRTVMMVVQVILVLLAAAQLVATILK